MSRDQVFICYSHNDRDWLEKLNEHLKVLEHEGLDIWHDTRLEPGARWKEEITQALDRAKVAIILVSHHFLGSSFIRDFELPKLLQGEEKEGVTVIPILVGQVSPQRLEKTGLTAFNFAGGIDQCLAAKSAWKIDEIMQYVTDRVENCFSDHPQIPPR